MEDAFCVSSLQRSLRLYNKPEIFNTDQGSQFTSHEFTDVLKAHDIKISMDGKGRWADNIFVERLWRTVKYEEIFLKDYGSVVELKKGLKRYFSFYNNGRSHQSLDYKAPAEVYQDGLMQAKGMGAVE